MTQLLCGVCKKKFEGYEAPDWMVEGMREFYKGLGEPYHDPLYRCPDCTAAGRMPLEMFDPKEETVH